MSRFIDADALEESKFHSKEDWTLVEVATWQWGWNDAIDAIIDNAPTVDAVEVVRCKDCEFYGEDEKWCRRLGLCGAFNENDFCSHGERREDE